MSTSPQPHCRVAPAFKIGRLSVGPPDEGSASGGPWGGRETGGVHKISLRRGRQRRLATCYGPPTGSVERERRAASGQSVACPHPGYQSWYCCLRLGSSVRVYEYFSVIVHSKLCCVSSQCPAMQAMSIVRQPYEYATADWVSGQNHRSTFKGRSNPLSLDPHGSTKANVLPSPATDLRGSIEPVFR